MRKAAVIIPVFAITLSASAQSTSVWFGGGLGLGYADISCARCGALFEDDPWEGGTGVAGYVTVGRTFTRSVRVGAELSLWHRRRSSLDRKATLATLGVGGRLYASENFFVSLGLGLGQSFLRGDGLIDSPGFAAAAGIGYDIYLSTNLALSPYVRFSQIVGEGGEGRSRGEAAEGADNPRFVQVGVALFKY